MFIKVTQVLLNFSHYSSGLQTMYPSYSAAIPHAFPPQVTQQSQQQNQGGIFSSIGTYFGIAGQQQSQQQNQLGGMNQQSPMNQQSSNYSAPVYKDEFKEVYVLLNSIKYMENAKQSNYETIMYFNDGSTMYIKESPEMILKMIHNENFNKKMDDLLK